MPAGTTFRTWKASVPNPIVVTAPTAETPSRERRWQVYDGPVGSTHRPIHTEVKLGSSLRPCEIDERLRIAESPRLRTVPGFEDHGRHHSPEK